MSDSSALLKAPGASFEAPEDFDAINQHFLDKGWSDGLPLVPPTAERVSAMLAYCDRPWDEAVAAIPPRYGAATPVRLAANAVMAGCRPEYFPLLMAAVEAMCEEAFNLYGIQTTTHLCAPLMIVNGPIARELKINSGCNAFGPGTQSNATIGRAVRLILLNIGGAIPGAGDMATFDSPAKYTYCVAENEAANPWAPLHVERGFPADTSTVTMFGGEAPHNVHDRESSTAEGILDMIAGTLASTGSNDVYHKSEPLIVFGPEHAAAVAAGGYTKADVRQYLYERARLPLGTFSPETIERRFRQSFEGRYLNAGLDTPVPMVQAPEDLMIIVLGGPGKHSACIPSLGVTRSVTRALKLRNGRYAHSVAEFRGA